MSVIYTFFTNCRICVHVVVVFGKLSSESQISRTMERSMLSGANFAIWLRFKEFVLQMVIAGKGIYFKWVWTGLNVTIVATLHCLQMMVIRKADRDIAATNTQAKKILWTNNDGWNYVNSFFKKSTNLVPFKPSQCTITDVSQSMQGSIMTVLVEMLTESPFTIIDPDSR